MVNLIVYLNDTDGIAEMKQETSQDIAWQQIVLTFSHGVAMPPSVRIPNAKCVFEINAA